MPQEKEQFTIEWDGRAVFCKQDLSKDIYKKYFSPDLPYEAARVNLHDADDNQFGLPVNWLSPVAAQEAVNRIVYGNRWLVQSEFRDMPKFNYYVLCSINGHRADYSKLPLTLRRKIANDLVVNGNVDGYFTITASRDTEREKN